MARALIGMGSNLGDRADLLARAVELLRALPTSVVLAQSRWLRTAPIGGPAGQGDFLNGALLLETALAPEKLHEALATIEADLGRQRVERWAARTLDLDLLVYDARVIDTPRLTVPHPRMAFRRFVLEPAAEIAPDMVHPTTGWTIARLLEHLNTAPPYVAVAGLPGVGKSSLARALAEAHGGVYLPDPTTGPALGDEIEFFERRRAALASRWPHFDRLLVSDFWLGQSCAYGRVRLDYDANQALRLRWIETRGEVLQPKLLVLLDPCSSSEPATGERADLREALRDLASLRDIGPVLCVRSASASEQLAEVSAAIEAMK